jgi:hypothetical protein
VALIRHSLIRWIRIASLMVGRAFILLKILHEGAHAPFLPKFEERSAENTELASSSPRKSSLTDGL